MTEEQVTQAWVRELLKVAPDADDTLLRWVAEQLAGDADPAALLALSADLTAIAGMIADEAACLVTAAPA